MPGGRGPWHRGDSQRILYFILSVTETLIYSSCYPENRSGTSGERASEHFRPSPLWRKNWNRVFISRHLDSRSLCLRVCPDPSFRQLPNSPKAGTQRKTIFEGGWRKFYLLKANILICVFILNSKMASSHSYKELKLNEEKLSSLRGL